MKITKTFENEVLTVKVEGRLDTSTAPQFEAEIKDDAQKAKKVIVDFARVDYISSAGLRALLALHKHKVADGGELVIAHPTEDTMSIFDMTGFSSILKIEKAEL